MQYLTRSQALEDVDNLIEVLVDAHPDPYSAFGGVIGFYRSLHNLVESLPNEGISPEELYGRLQTFVSQLKDGHTKLFYEDHANLQLPITFEVVENHLVVNGYYDPRYAWCIGSRVLEVDGLPLHKLLERLNWSAENEYVKLAELGASTHFRIGTQRCLYLHPATAGLK
jgi:hypothetical protein